MKQKFLTVSQAAQHKGVSRTAIYKAIEEKRLPATSMLGRVVVRESDLSRWEPRPGGKAGKPRSKDVKARISEAQKRRWARQRKITEQSYGL